MVRKIIDAITVIVHSQKSSTGARLQRVPI